MFPIEKIRLQKLKLNFTQLILERLIKFLYFNILRKKGDKLTFFEELIAVGAEPVGVDPVD